MEANYKRTVAGSVGAGVAAVFNASGRQYYILEHKTESLYHHAGESQKIIVDQVELGRDSACQVRFDESFETVSRRHAAIVKEGENWKIIPLSQTNTTLVNGQPISEEKILNSGDEIRLSSRGPLMGFIIPQGKQSLVSSIGMTERLNLFRQQALAPYKRALWCIVILFVLAVAGLVAWNLYQADKFNKEIETKQQQIEQVQQDLTASDELIEALNVELENSQNASAVERARTQKKLAEAQAEREALVLTAVALNEELQTAVEKYNLENEVADEQIRAANKQIEELQNYVDQVKKRDEDLEKQKREAEANSLKIYSEDESAPKLDKKKENVLKKF